MNYEPFSNKAEPDPVIYTDIYVNYDYQNDLLLYLMWYVKLDLGQRTFKANTNTEMFITILAMAKLLA